MLSRQALLAARTAPRSLVLAAPAAVRTFAAAPTPTPAAAEVKPPVALFGLDGTYATALYTAAVKTKTLEPTTKTLSALGELLRRDVKLGTILATPTLSAADKSAIVAELQKSTGSASQPTVQHFLEALAENNRLGLLQDITGKFAELIRAAQGQVELVVTSATPLDNRTLARLESAVAKSPLLDNTSGSKKLTVTNKVNPDVLGGLVVEIGDRTIDLSVAGRVAKLNKLLTDNL